MKFYHLGNPKEIAIAMEDVLPEGAVEIAANSVEAAFEKHIPDVKVNGDLIEVVVGTVEHPMLDVHYISWIALVRGKETQIKKLQPGEKPVAEFVLKGAKRFEVYAFCNLHGLWVAKVDE